MMDMNILPKDNLLPPNYCGEFDNSAGIMIIDELLTCPLKVLRPVENLKK